jgi:hypothetical protein
VAQLSVVSGALHRSRDTSTLLRDRITVDSNVDPLQMPSRTFAIPPEPHLRRQSDDRRGPFPLGAPASLVVVERPSPCMEAATPKGPLTRSFSWSGRRDLNARPSPWQRHGHLPASTFQHARDRSSQPDLPSRPTQSAQIVERSTTRRPGKGGHGVGGRTAAWTKLNRLDLAAHGSCGSWEPSTGER